MRALQIVNHEGPSSLKVAEVDEPVPSGDEVLIDVHAAGVAFPELLQTRGRYQIQPDPPFTPGYELAGVVRSAPAGAGVSEGDRVVAVPGIGSLAEVAVCRAEHVLPLPDSVDFAHGAALPMNYMTVHLALIRRGAVKAGEVVLVHGAAGGIGSAACQVARAIGAEVIAVVSTSEKAESARAAGAQHVVIGDDFLGPAKELTAGRGVDAVLDPVGGDRLVDSVRALAFGGRVLAIGFAAGEVPTVKTNRLIFANASVTGVGWHYALAQPGYVRGQWDELLPWISDGQLDPLLDGVYPLDDAIRGFERLDSRAARGKVVVSFRSDGA